MDPGADESGHFGSRRVLVMNGMGKGRKDGKEKRI